MKVSFFKLCFAVVLALSTLCQGVQAQTFPTVSLPFPGDTSGAQLFLGLNVAFNASGFSVPLPGGGTALLHWKYCYEVTMSDDLKLPNTFVTRVEVENCLAALFVAKQPKVILDGIAGVPHPELWSVPIWSAATPQIVWAGVVGGPAFLTKWEYCFYSNIAPGIGSVTIGATRINPDCSLETPSLNIPYFGPCTPPGNPGGECPKPICNAGGPYTAIAGVPVAFNGGGSSAGSGQTITSYAWDFGDGSFGAGVSPNHAYATAGIYTASLTITNSCGKSRTCTTAVCINRPPQEVCPKPICNAGGPYTGTVGNPVVFNGTGSSGPPPKTIVTWHWDFGDSTGFYGATPSHTYAAAGTYVVTLTVTNNCGQSCSCITRVTITNPPTAPPPCTYYNKVAQVYPALPAPVASPFKPLGTWIGDDPVPFPLLPVPGILSLATLPDNLLNVNAFITCCPGGVVNLSSVKLVKTVPGSQQFPGCFQPYTVTQNGRANIRTWWALDYTMPGTKFTLTLDGTCTTPGTPGGGPRICPRHGPGGSYRSPCNCNQPSNPGTPGATTPYSDVWVWEVVANPDTFLLLIDLFRFPEIGQTEVPCIMDENVYDGLVVGAKKVKEKVKQYELQRTAFNKAAAIDAILSLQAYILANTLSADWLDDAAQVINFPPGPFLPVGAGILNTCENPCSCKLLVDLEAIQKQLDIPTPL